MLALNCTAHESRRLEVAELSHKRAKDYGYIANLLVCSPPFLELIYPR
jgi:hypothetical protein